MSDEINEEVERICEDWQTRIKRIENSEEGLSNEACKQISENYLDETFRRMMAEDMSFEESLRERELVESTLNDLIIALNEANTRYERKSKTIWEKFGYLVPDIILSKLGQLPFRF